MLKTASTTETLWHYEPARPTKTILCPTISPGHDRCEETIQDAFPQLVSNLRQKDVFWMTLMFRPALPKESKDTEIRQYRIYNETWGILAYMVNRLKFLWSQVDDWALITTWRLQPQNINHMLYPKSYDWVRWFLPCWCDIWRMYSDMLKRRIHPIGRIPILRCSNWTMKTIIQYESQVWSENSNEVWGQVEAVTAHWPINCGTSNGTPTAEPRLGGVCRAILQAELFGLGHHRFILERSNTLPKGAFPDKHDGFTSFTKQKVWLVASLCLLHYVCFTMSILYNSMI